MSKPEYRTKEDEITFNILNENVVKRLQAQGEVKLPAKKVDVPRDMRWNLKTFNGMLLQGIQNGDSVVKIAASIFPEIQSKGGIVAKNEQSAIRSARTMTTEAENRGRLDSYDNLAEQGVIQKKVWIATPDDRTRESHLEIDGEEVDIDADFSNGLQYPADPNGDPSEVWNCRCSMRTHIVGVRKADGHVEPIGKEREQTMHSEQIAEERERRAEAEPEEEKEPPREKSEILKELETQTFEYRPVKKLDRELTQEEIVERLAGGDQTKGSCASLSLAYAGNRAGLDVIDFRGGDSRTFFSKDKNLQKIFALPNVVTFSAKNTNDFKAVAELLPNMIKGKEYILSAGKHAAIIKQLSSGQYVFLEMQSRYQNEFKPLDSTVLKNRFGCQRSHSVAGFRLELTTQLVDVESLGKASDFKDILGYLNTAADKQMKGASGFAK